jgi:hypothetical protein
MIVGGLTDAPVVVLDIVRPALELAEAQAGVGVE